MSKWKPIIRPFWGVDGEGCGRDRQGRQHYMLLRAGPHELYTGKPLHIEECLSFLTGLPREPLLVGYSFGYDATQILRQLPPERLKNGGIDAETGEVIRGTGIFDESASGNSFYTWFRHWGVEFIPNQYFRVCTTEPRRRDDGSVGIERLDGTGRTINEVSGFFRGPFISALKSMGVGAKHWPMLERMKAKRAGFDRITPEIRDYCRIECELLAELMTRFREQSHDCDLRPNEWRGVGWLASYLHRKHNTPDALAVYRAVPRGCRDLANEAYYAGRFEVTRSGDVSGPIYEYDLNSAFAAAMVGLPCITHGKWQACEPLDLVDAARRGDLFLARVTFDHPTGATNDNLCSLPIRKQDGRLIFPRAGRGVYWSVELREAQRLGAAVMLESGWRYERRCACKTCAWIEDIYEQRRALGERGLPLKIALAALYGKLIQRRYGIARHYNILWASLLTARVRARMLSAIAHDPEQIVMLASDGIYSRVPLPLDFGDGLGQWRAGPLHKSLFIVQPGVYWGEEARTRGVSTSLFVPHLDRFEKRWNLYRMIGDGPAPDVAIPLTLFTGLRLAVTEGKPELAGRWSREDRTFAFDWSAKRSEGGNWEGTAIRSYPQPGDATAASVPYDPAELAATFDLKQMQLDDQPDPLDLTPP